jgi:DHA1 family inner membrane transport protein
MVPPTCIALIGDTFPEKRRPMSIATITMQPGMSGVLGVPLSAVLGDFVGWRFPFLALGLALLLAALLLFVLVPHHRPLTTSLDLGKRLRRVATFPVTWYMAGTNMMARITWGVIVTFFPAFLMVTYGLGTAEVALPVAVVALWTTAAPLLGGRIGGGRRRLPVIAALLLAATIPGLGVFLLGWGVWFSVFTAGFFMLLIVPVTTILMILVAETGGASRGTLAGIISSSNWGGTAAGAAIGGLLVAQISYGALSFLLVGAIVGSGLLMAFIVNEGAVARAREHFSTSPERDSKTTTAGP